MIGCEDFSWYVLKIHAPLALFPNLERQ